MARLSKVLLGLWLLGMFASGSALAAVREIDLGVLSPGQAAGLFGVLPSGVESTEIYEFDIAGAPINTVGVSAVSLLTTPGNPGAATTFDITTEMLQWDGSSFVGIPGTVGTGPAVVLSADVSPAAGTNPAGNANKYNRHYELTITATPPSGFATYGGSIAVVAVPEPSMTLLLIGGLISVGFLSRRRMKL
jgi:hypothetical protein